MDESEPIARFDNHKFARKFPEVWKFVKFACMGVITAIPEMATQFLVLYGFRALHVTTLPNFFFFNWVLNNTPPRPGFDLAVLFYAYMISTCVGYTLGFFLNRKVSFHADSNVALST
ncbi:MAG: hypothetical protein LBB50_06750, partial [Oscillospiraceae bacterium]|nr:hypothetical protein [Oscillospiraceae bacterium]